VCIFFRSWQAALTVTNRATSISGQPTPAGSIRIAPCAAQMHVRVALARHTASRIHLFAAGATNFSLRLSCVFSFVLVTERESARVAFPARDFKGPAAKLKTNPINEAAAVCQQQKNETQLAALSFAFAAMFCALLMLLLCVVIIIKPVSLFVLRSLAWRAEES
jgi:hypothetical protein